MSVKDTGASVPLPRFQDHDRRARLLDACSQLEPIFRAYASEKHMPGVAYGVVAGGELIFSGGFGVRRVDTQALVDADTVFRIASMTKSFTALAIVKLRDQGRLSLDEPALTYVPELAGLLYPTTDIAPITVRQLLAMSAGWPQDDPWADRQLYRTDAAMREIYDGGIPFSNPPGVTFEYSNTGYMVLGRIITHVAGVPAMDYVTQEILQPLGMAATVWNADDVAVDRLALGYRRQDEAWLEEALLSSGGDVAAFAGLFSSVRDLARWVALFQSAWPPRNEPESAPVRRSSLRAMQQVWRMEDLAIPRTRLGAPPKVHAGGYGYGLSISHNGRWRSVGHGGGVPGFGSHMRWAPDHDIGIIALANVTYANVHQACTDALERLIAAAQLQPRLPQPAQALQDARIGVLRLFDAWDDAVADEVFADNFFLDEDRARWQRKLEQLHQTHGRLQPDGVLHAENWLRGRWRMQGERGWCWVWISLAPTRPPRIQEMDIEATLPPSPAMQAAAESVAALTARPTRHSLRRLFLPSADLEALWDRVRLANILCGPCNVHEVVSGDGAGRAVFRFVGPKGSADVELALDDDGERLLEADFHWSR